MLLAINWVRSSFYNPNKHVAAIQRFRTEVQATNFCNQIVILEKTPGNKVPGTIKAGNFMNPYGRESWDGRLFPLNEAIENTTAALRTTQSATHACTSPRPSGPSTQPALQTAGTTRANRWSNHGNASPTSGCRFLYAAISWKLATGNLRSAIVSPQPVATVST